jgi:putative DNA primase/helicase
MTASDLARRLKAKRAGRYWICCCPAHDDRTPSCTFTDGERAVLVKCWAGCEAADVIAAWRAAGVWESEGATRSRRRLQRAGAW